MLYYSKREQIYIDYFNAACDLSHCAKNVFALCHCKILLYIFLKSAYYFDHIF